jgi:hypothetical protein
VRKRTARAFHHAYSARTGVLGDPRSHDADRSACTTGSAPEAAARRGRRPRPQQSGAHHGCRSGGRGPTASEDRRRSLGTADEGVGRGGGGGGGGGGGRRATLVGGGPTNGGGRCDRRGEGAAARRAAADDHAVRSYRFTTGLRCSEKPMSAHGIRVARFSWGHRRPASARPRVVCRCRRRRRSRAPSYRQDAVHLVSRPSVDPHHWSEVSIDGV